jgi:hypothetical protein
MRTCDEVAIGEGTSRGAGKVVAAFAPAAGEATTPPQGKERKSSEERE